VAEALGCGHRTVERLRERFVSEGLNAALAHKQPARPPPGAGARRSRRGKADCPRVLGLPGRAAGVDSADAGRQAGRTRGG
jgi:hypothetical protein